MKTYTRLGILGLLTAVTLAAVLLMLMSVHAAGPGDYPEPIVATPYAIQASDSTNYRWADVSGDCVAFRDEDGRVFLRRTTGNTLITITTKTEPTGPRKIVISKGLLVWRSDREGEQGLWGYYEPTCNDANLAPNSSYGSFHIISRTNAHAPALSNGVVIYDTNAPKGSWYVAATELDADHNGMPDAAEAGYDPSDDALVRPVSNGSPAAFGTEQRFADVYWGEDYKIACWYDNTGGVDKIQCNDLANLTAPQPWTSAFTVTTSTLIPLLDFSGILAVHQDLVVWSDGRDFDRSGVDLYIADLDPDDDGVVDPLALEIYPLVDRPWEQMQPAIHWPYIIWTDRRNGNQPDIYGYDLRQDTDADGRENWRDDNRTCIDPAEFPVVRHAAVQQKPEIDDYWGIWEDEQSGHSRIQGFTLLTLLPTARIPMTGTAQEKVLHALGDMQRNFPTVQSIPGYDLTTEQIIRYKSWADMSGTEHLITASYPAITGTYVTGFDFCYFGTAVQKQFLGRAGRGFIYDQALALIAYTMLSDTKQVEEIGTFVASLQNTGQFTTTPSGSFGFGFNGLGYYDEADNFYDMNYLRGGANGWLGYGYLFAYQKTETPQFLDVAIAMGDYLLTQQITDTADRRYGLFTGGYGSYPPDNYFVEETVDWVATEHNIDIYFFLRDLGRETGEERFTAAAALLRANIPKLWDEGRGRLNQGMYISGTLGVDGLVVMDTADALDAASWGAMYWLAVDDLEKARRSLAYTDQVYRNTVTVSDTVNISPTITIWGYKPYASSIVTETWAIRTAVWSEGSLGVAMAHLKLGHTLLDRCDLEGLDHIKQAQAILNEMEKLQALDPNGGIFYAVYEGSEIPDFARAPSAAGGLWLLLMQQATAEEAWRDAFWRADAPVDGCSIYLPIVIR